MYNNKDIEIYVDRNSLFVKSPAQRHDKRKLPGLHSVFSHFHTGIHSFFSRTCRKLIYNIITSAVGLLIKIRKLFRSFVKLYSPKTEQTTATVVSTGLGMLEWNGISSARSPICKQNVLVLKQLYLSVFRILFALINFCLIEHCKT